MSKPASSASKKSNNSNDNKTTTIVTTTTVPSIQWGKSLIQAIGNKFIDNKGQSYTRDHLQKPGVIGLYFSAHWCSPCRAVTPKLIKTYNLLVSSNKSFNVVFISSDHKQSEFKDYFNTMPWLALPFDSEHGEKLSEMYGVKGIPALILIDGSTGKTITKDGRTVITDDPTGSSFPWTK
jgi:thiol-disulfide isomerase/thioredoxin